MLTWYSHAPGQHRWAEAEAEVAEIVAHLVEGDFEVGDEVTSLCGKTFTVEIKAPSPEEKASCGNCLWAKAGQRERLRRRRTGSPSTPSRTRSRRRS